MLAVVESTSCRDDFWPFGHRCLLSTSPHTSIWADNRLLAPFALWSTCGLLNLSGQVIFLACSALSIFDYPVASSDSAILCPLGCYSTICLLIVHKWWSGSGFVSVDLLNFELFVGDDLLNCYEYSPLRDEVVFSQSSGCMQIWL